ncbi:MAG: hypothetical protein NT172_20420, partial [Planctomycetota bacterium]|nr:hypothetical protein [Planctomycetota bacterium]
MDRTSSRIGTRIRSLFARITGRRAVVVDQQKMARKAAAVRRLSRLMNSSESAWMPTQILASHSMSVFARIRRGVTQRISALTIRNPFSGDNLERTKRAFAFSFIETTLEKRQLLATVDFDGSRLIIETDTDNEALTILAGGTEGDYTLTSTTNFIFSANATANAGLSNATALTLNVYSNLPLSSIQITNNVANSGSSFGFGTSPGSFVDDLTVNFSNATSGTITVANATNFVSGADLSLTTTSNSITVSAPLSANSTSDISLTARNIVVTGNITAGLGNIILDADNNSYQIGDFDGVCISGAGVNVNTTSGNITIDGRAGGGSVNKGVNLTSSKVQASGSGCVTITGMSGNGSGGSAYGILASGATVTTSTGSLTVNGTSCGTGASSYGVYLKAFANISATGVGDVTITGTSANGTTNAYGINVSGSKVTTNSGSLTVNGTSCGTGTNSYGVYLRTSANISATGVGNVTITGTSANGTNNAYGINVSGFSNVTTSSGSITVNGTSCGTGSNSKGVFLDSSNISATGTGNVTITGSTPGNPTTGIGIDSYDSGSKVYSNAGLITLTANSLNLVGTVNATTAGNVLIQTFGAGVNLGNGTDTSANLGLSQTELDLITAGTLTIGNSSTGAIVNTAAISRNNATLGTNLTLISVSSITQTGAGNLTISGTANFVSSGSGTAGNITLGNATNNFGTVTTSGSNVTINDTDALILGVTTATNLTVTTVGAVTQSGAATVTGIASLTNSGSGIAGNITLGNATNNFGTVTTSGSNITLVDANNITLGTITPSGDLNVTAGNITITTNISNAGQLQSYTGAVINGG